MSAVAGDENGVNFAISFQVVELSVVQASGNVSGTTGARHSVGDYSQNAQQEDDVSGDGDANEYSVRHSIPQKSRKSSPQDRRELQCRSYQTRAIIRSVTRSISVRASAYLLSWERRVKPITMPQIVFGSARSESSFSQRPHAATRSLRVTRRGR